MECEKGFCGQEWNEAQRGGKDRHLVQLNWWADVTESEYAAHLAGNKRQRRDWAATGILVVVMTC